MIYEIQWSSAHIRNQRVTEPWTGAFPQEKRKVADKYKEAMQHVDMQAWLAHKIKQSSGDSFVFILQKVSPFGNQPIDGFLSFLKEFELEPFIALETPFVTNPVHAERGPNLKMFVLQTPKT